MSRLIILFGILLSLCGKSFAQDTLIFVDGRIKSHRIQLINDEEDVILYRINEKSSRVKVKAFEKDDVFMIIYGNGEKELIYKQDSSVGNNYSVKQMALYIKGGQVAQATFKTPLTTISGIALGVLTYGIGGALGVENGILMGLDGSMVALIEPLVHPMVLGIKRPHYPKRKISNALENNKYFKYGYIDTAKQKRRKNAVIGSTIGILGGMLIRFATK